jgi:hypothetical protein
VEPSGHLTGRAILFIAFAFTVMADPVSSIAYAIESALRHLDGNLGDLFLAMALVIATIAVIAATYHQLIRRFPEGGGGARSVGTAYGDAWAFIPLGALLVDFVITVAISCAAGAPSPPPSPLAPRWTPGEARRRPPPEAVRDARDEVAPTAQRSRGCLGQQRRLRLAGRRLLRPSLGLCGALTRLSGEAPHHQRGDQQHHQGHHVVRLGDRQAVEGLDEEEVECEDAYDGSGEGGDLPTSDRHREYGDQIDHPEASRIGDRVEERDQRGGEGDPGEGLESGGGDAARSRPRTHVLHLDPV